MSVGEHLGQNSAELPVRRDFNFFRASIQGKQVEKEEPSVRTDLPYKLRAKPCCCLKTEPLSVHSSLALAKAGWQAREAPADGEQWRLWRHLANRGPVKAVPLGYPCA